jgi:hypothetical protein
VNCPYRSQVIFRKPNAMPAVDKEEGQVEEKQKDILLPLHRHDRKILKVEAEICQRGHWLHLYFCYLAFRVQRERRECVRCQTPIAPPDFESVVLPVLHVAGQCRSMTESHHQFTLLRGDGNVSIPSVLVVADILLDAAETALTPAVG